MKSNNDSKKPAYPNLITALTGVGRPVAYYPSLARVFGSAKAAILFCQLGYWTPRAHPEADGWIYKTRADLCMETGLTREEELSARRRLQRLGVLECYYCRWSHQLSYKLNLEKLQKLLKEQDGKPVVARRETRHAGPVARRNGKAVKAHRENLRATTEKPSWHSGKPVIDIIETTTQTTSEITSEKPMGTDGQKIIQGRNGEKPAALDEDAFQSPYLGSSLNSDNPKEVPFKPPEKPWPTVDEFWEKYVELMRAAWPGWSPDRERVRSYDFSLFVDMLTQQTDDRWKLLTEFVEWRAGIVDIPSKVGRFTDRNFGRFLRTRSERDLDADMPASFLPVESAQK